MNRRLATLALVLVVLALAAPAFAQEHGAAPAGKNICKFIGAAFVIGIAARGRLARPGPWPVGGLRASAATRAPSDRSGSR